MAESINVDKLAAQIARELKMFSGEVVDKVNASSERVGKAAVKRLKQTSPKDSGDYRKSWTMTTEKAVGQPHNRIVHARAPHYRLTHLLEHGHAKVNGGRVDPRPHIRPAEEEVIKQFVAEIEEAIERG